jgi:hypothetical protein
MDALAATVTSEQVIFPLMVGHMEGERFKWTDFAGTGFFISTRALALTAAHVLGAAKPDQMTVAMLSNAREPMMAYPVKWSVQLPDSDIAVMRLDTPLSPCVRTSFAEFKLSQEVHTTGVAECMFEAEAGGATNIYQRSARGYVAYGRRKWVAASFPLPAGMSGSPAMIAASGLDYAAGVLVGQMRSEIVEDLLNEVTETTASGKSVYVEKVSRVEYTSRIDALWYHRDHRAPEFGGKTFSELVAQETRQS